MPDFGQMVGGLLGDAAWGAFARTMKEKGIFLEQTKAGDKIQLTITLGSPIGVYFDTFLAGCKTAELTIASPASQIELHGKIHGRRNYDQLSQDLKDVKKILEKMQHPEGSG